MESDRITTEENKQIEMHKYWVGTSELSAEHWSIILHSLGTPNSDAGRLVALVMPKEPAKPVQAAGAPPGTPAAHLNE